MSVTNSPFSDLSEAPPDPILDIKKKFLADSNPRKVDLTVGVYQDDFGRTPLLPSVQAAFAAGLSDLAQAGYLAIEGHLKFLDAVATLALGSEHPAIKAGRIASVQALGGTGSLRMGAELLRLGKTSGKVFLTNPTWPNHQAIFHRAGFEVENLPYYSYATPSKPVANGLDADAFFGALKGVPHHSIVVLHASCHNPTGVDPTMDQWKLIRQHCIDQELTPFLDFAYQGFKGGIGEDREVIELFAESGTPFLVAYSCSKNFSLYRRRTGALLVALPSKREAEIVQTQLRSLIRASYSNSPVDGAAVVSYIVENKDRRAKWEEEVAEMRNRIHSVRAALLDRLDALGLGELFTSLRGQVGMFSFLGLDRVKMERLEREFGVYAIGNSRICVPALNQGNLDYVAEAISKVV